MSTLKELLGEFGLDDGSPSQEKTAAPAQQDEVDHHPV